MVRGHCAGSRSMSGGRESQRFYVLDMCGVSSLFNSDLPFPSSSGSHSTIISIAIT